MKVLSSAPFSQISFLIRGVNYKNIYALLNQNLSSNDIRLFSKVEQRNNEAIWYIDSDVENYKSFKDATPEEKGEIADLIEERSAQIKTKITTLKEIAEFQQFIFSIPSENQIFYTYDINQNLIVTLAQWGCGDVSLGKPIDISSTPIAVPYPNPEVNLLIKYTDNSPADNETFYFSLVNDHPAADTSAKPFKTDTEGKKSLGKRKKGLTFNISNKEDKSDVNHQITVTEQSLYELFFPCFTSYRVQVVNQFDEPYPNEQILANNQLFTTDEKGCFEVNRLEYIPNTNIDLALASNTEKKAQFTLQKNADNNHFKFVLPVDCEYNLHIKTLLENGTAVPNYKLQIEKEGKNEPYETDENGILSFKNLTQDQEITVVDWNNPENKQTITIQRGDNYCDVIVELPKEKQVRIKLLDLEGNPIKGTNLNVKTKAGTFKGTTDVDGYIHLPFTNFKHKEKVKVNFTYLK